MTTTLKITLTLAVIAVAAGPALACGDKPCNAAGNEHADHAAMEAAHHADVKVDPAVADGIITDYLAIQAALAHDSLDGVAEHADALVAEAGTAQDLLAAAKTVAEAADLAAARAAFGPLSTQVIPYRTSASGDVPRVAYCGMVKQSWLQPDGPIANPYYGSSMLRCGSFVK